MDHDVQEATHKWNREVNEEIVRLIEQGVPPFDAADKARDNVSRRRRTAAGLPCQAFERSERWA